MPKELKKEPQKEPYKNLNNPPTRNQPNSPLSKHLNKYKHKTDKIISSPVISRPLACIRLILISINNFNSWLFGQGARVVEFINTTLLIGFVMPFLYNLELILTNQTYARFQYTGSALWWSFMLMLGIAQWWAMSAKGVKSNQISGYILIVSGWVWGLVSATFALGAPPLTTAPVVYSIISFVCTVAGFYLLKYNKAIEDEINKG